VYALDEVGRVQDETVHPALERRTAEVGGGRLEGLQARAHPAVEDEDTLAERFEK
jgi:hypothetical protein